MLGVNRLSEDRYFDELAQKISTDYMGLPIEDCMAFISGAIAPTLPHSRDSYIYLSYHGEEDGTERSEFNVVTAGDLRYSIGAKNGRVVSINYFPR